MTTKTRRPRSFWCQLAPARPVGALWTILSFLVSLICLFSFVQPVWFTRKWSNRGVYHLQPPHLTLGLFTFCQQVHGSSSAYQCYHHERLYELKLPPSLIWQMSVISFGIGSGLFLVTAFVALAALCCQDTNHTRVAAISSSVQLFCVLSMIIGLVLLPGSFGTPILQSFCGTDAFPYYLGHCQLGWSYGLAIIGTIMALFCPYLARHTKFQSFEVAPVEVLLPSTMFYQKLTDAKEYYI